MNAQNILTTEVQFSASGSPINSCDFVYDRQAGTISLRADNAMSLAVKPLGSTQVLQNSQCQIGAASVSLVGLQLLETVNITFKGGFNGLKTIYMSASEAAGLTTGFVANGTYTVCRARLSRRQLGCARLWVRSQPAVHRSPVSDQGGASFINGVAFLMTTNNTNNACNVVYDRTAGTITLSFDNAANGAAKILLGSTQSISNSQCTLNGANTTVFTGPTSLVFTIDLAFNSSFFGPKFVYVFAGETSTNTGNVLLGSWNVTGGTPTATSVSPSSGAGNSPTYSFVATDSVSQANISGMNMLITSGSPNNITNACSLVYNRTNSTIGLYADDGVTLSTKPIGSSATLQNSQCAVGFTVAFFSGNSVTFNVNTVYKPAFNGPKTVYLQANEPGSNSGFVSRGTWTVQ